jgi:hypothetical protein
MNGRFFCYFRRQSTNGKVTKCCLQSVIFCVRVISDHSAPSPDAYCETLRERDDGDIWNVEQKEFATHLFVCYYLVLIF